MTQQGNVLREELRSFVAEHRNGWTHGHWEMLLRQLSDSGFDTAQPDTIGMELERERVLFLLEDAGIRGLGPKRREAVAGEFGNLWTLKHASVAELSERSRLPKSLAEKVHAVVN